jgi:hypothetical protein
MTIRGVCRPRLTAMEYGKTEAYCMTMLAGWVHGSAENVFRKAVAADLAQWRQDVLSIGDSPSNTNDLGPRSCSGRKQVRSVLGHHRCKMATLSGCSLAAKQHLQLDREQGEESYSIGILAWTVDISWSDLAITINSWRPGRCCRHPQPAGNVCALLIMAPHNLSRLQYALVHTNSICTRRRFISD